MEEQLNSVDAEQEDVVDSQTDDLENESETEEGEKESEVAETTKQGPDENAIYAKLRRKAEEEMKAKYEPKLAKFQELAGVDIDQALTQLEQSKLQEEAKQYAETNGLTEEDAADRLKDKQRLQALETELRSTKRLTTLEKEKEPFKDKLYFKDLEPEIDQLIAENAQKGIDISVEATFNYLRGKNLDELMSKETEKTVKSTIANIHDRARRTVVNQDSSHGDDLDTSEVDVEMANAFGTDPKKIASYVKKQTKRS
ncbi:MAG: hypothetical protein WC616_02455 [Candidatus Omnitrophota bacterium]